MHTVARLMAADQVDPRCCFAMLEVPFVDVDGVVSTRRAGTQWTQGRCQDDSRASAEVNAMARSDAGRRCSIVTIALQVMIR